MKPFLFLITAIFLLLPCVSTPAQAQDDFYKKQDDFYQDHSLPKGKAEDSGKTLKEIFEDHEEKEKRTGEKTGTQLANDFFYKCAAIKDDYMNMDARNDLCGCVSAKISRRLSNEEIYALYDESKEGKNARAHLLIDAYVPCMLRPIKEVTVGRCLKTKQMEQFRTGRKTICGCVAGMMHDYVEREKHNLVSEGVKYNPMTLDPLEHFIGSTSYYNLMSDYLRSCIYQQAYGN